VFAKLGMGRDSGEKFAAELAGSAFLREHAGIATPTPVVSGLVVVDGGSVLVTEALVERPPPNRTGEDWRSIGQVLATLHQVHAAEFGFQHPRGFFGPLCQDNTPVSSNRWVDFYAERRVLPLLQSTAASGRLPMDLAGGIERLPSLCGPELPPTLLHGDAQQNNFVSTDAGAVAADVAPYFGHPEIDLALLDYFHPVPGDVFHEYRERAPLDPGFSERRDLAHLRRPRVRRGRRRPVRSPCPRAARRDGSPPQLANRSRGNDPPPPPQHRAGRTTGMFHPSRSPHREPPERVESTERPTGGGSDQVVTDPTPRRCTWPNYSLSASQSIGTPPNYGRPSPTLTYTTATSGPPLPAVGGRGRSSIWDGFVAPAWGRAVGMHGSLKALYPPNG
jgi:fructosamine-3-kinase